MNIRPASAVALLLAGALALAGCSTTAESDHSSMPGMDHSASEAPGADASAADANAADVMFAAMMIPHHEQAVEMADLVLGKDGIDPRVVDLAERIKAAQGPEVETMQEWLDDWGMDPDDAMSGDDGMMGHGDGMMSADDMESLEAANGDEASRLFLEQMIVHHEGAVDMAEAQVADGQNADAVALAESIIETQTDEIAEMKDLLATP